MGRKKKTTRAKIVSAAWKLFYKQGYDETTVDEIIAVSGTSKGSFYHYFKSKDELLRTLSTLFDDKYEELLQEIPPEMDSFDKLLFLNRSLFRMINDSISIELIASLYASQINTKGERHLLDQNRFYYKLLNQIVAEGQIRGQLNAAVPAGEIVKVYAMCERALIYDWCICQGGYNLEETGASLMLRFLRDFRATPADGAVAMK